MARLLLSSVLMFSTVFSCNPTEKPYTENPEAGLTDTGYIFTEFRNSENTGSADTALVPETSESSTSEQRKSENHRKTPKLTFHQTIHKPSRKQKTHSLPDISTSETKAKELNKSRFEKPSRDKCCESFCKNDVCEDLEKRPECKHCEVYKVFETEVEYKDDYLQEYFVEYACSLHDPEHRAKQSGEWEYHNTVNVSLVCKDTKFFEIGKEEKKTIASFGLFHLFLFMSYLACNKVK